MARLLFVHAHPDDETLTTGLTIAHYLSRGHDAEVLTMTLGEQGEVIPAELAHLSAEHEDTLGEYRRGELDAAMARLGARHTVWGRSRDSGMAGTDSARDPRAFVNADLDAAAADIAALLRDRRPEAVLTYDRGGGYGHPDHIQTRRVVQAGLDRLADEHLPAHYYEIVTPASWAAADRRWLADHDLAPGLTVPTLQEPYAVSVVPDEVVTHVVTDLPARDRQAHALAAHRTQVSVYDGYYALSNLVAHRLAGREAFVRLDPRTGNRLPRNGAQWSVGLLGEDPAG